MKKFVVALSLAFLIAITATVYAQSGMTGGQGYGGGYCPYCGQQWGGGYGMGPGMMGGYGMGPGMMGGYGMGPGMMGGYGMGPGMMGGYGMGPGMMGGYGMGPGMMRGYGMGPGMMGSGYYGQSEECQKFLDETAGLRKELYNKRYEYSEAYRNPKTSPETVVKLEKEIREIQEKIQAKGPGTYQCPW